MAEAGWQLASDAQVHALLASWDARQGGFAPGLLEGDFGKAVEHARALGHRGEGATCAIIDAGFDPGHPGLAGDLVDVHGEPEPGTRHGTAVALLAREVAPRARLQLHGVSLRTLESEDSMDVLRGAILRAGGESPSVLNLSIQKRRWAVRRGSSQAGPSFEELGRLRSLANYVPEEPPCPVCDAAASVRRGGVPVVAAAGNVTGRLSCPARHPLVASIGLIHVKRETRPWGNGYVEQAMGQPPSQDQSLHHDYALPEESARLKGTSFAAPLFAGVLALGLPGNDLGPYLEAVFWAGAGNTHLARHQAREVPASPDPNDTHLDFAETFLAKALATLPHLHQPDAAPANGERPARECPWCGFLALPAYLGWGQVLLHRGKADGARRQFEVARDLAPWNADVWSCIGASHEALGDLAGAIASFERAVELGPSRLHRWKLEQLRKR